MKFGKGIPVSDISIPDETMDICAAFNQIAKKSGSSKRGWFKAEASYHVAADGSIDLIDELKVSAVGENGCGKRLAPGQWWAYCGETDMGQGFPALCTECGGEYKLCTPAGLLPSP